MLIPHMLYEKRNAGTMVRIMTAAPTLAAALSTSISLACNALGRSSISLRRPSARYQYAARMTAAFSTSGEQPNHLLSIPASGQGGSLRHSYSALRHGQSLANVAKIISSDPKISTVEHGLSDFGHEQAREAGKLFARQFHAGDAGDNGSDKYSGVAIFSSDFKRARETAQHMADACAEASIPVYKDGVVLETKLRERNFGNLNGGSDERYQDVWDIDIKDPSHNEFDVESVYSVVERTTKLVLDIDEELSSASQGEEKWKCILVAHGDVLQILQTGFKKMDGSLHRTLPHLETATVRELKVADAPLCGYHAME